MPEKGQKKLMNIREVQEYLGLGETKAREIVRGGNGFSLRIGNRWYVDKAKLDRWLDQQML